MTHEELDVMWSIATRKSIEENQPYTRYEFAKMVAAHTLMNIDPSKFISWQEGFEAGVAKEREACADMVFLYIAQTVNMEACGCLASVAHDIRARGEA